MPKTKRAPKENIGYRCPKDLLGKIDTLIEKNEFERRPDVITAALRFYFENRGKDAEAVVTDLFEKGKFDALIRVTAEGAVAELLEETKKRT